LFAALTFFAQKPSSPISKTQKLYRIVDENYDGFLWYIPFIEFGGCSQALLLSVHFLY